MAKLGPEDRKKFLLDKLEEQRHLLRKSINEFAGGDLAEGLRIASSIRVLVHETGSSKPLLKQLTPNYLQLPIFDEYPKSTPPPPGVQAAVVMFVPVSIKVRADGVFLNPELESGSRTASILGKWWNRPSLVLPGLGGISRKEVVLGLANKEGGAHVDSDMTKRYQQLLSCQSFQVGWNKESVTPLNLSRFMAGQAGVELLQCIDSSFPLPNEQNEERS